ncbi:MFS transporter [Amycolatopsis sp. cmx-4-61]|uniref:MFS transporter n=1 Tax=Amycolatopsis sp. cmx-4-61 TaxID=2790937 RepID=UPI00397C3B40
MPQDDPEHVAHGAAVPPRPRRNALAVALLISIGLAGLDSAIVTTMVPPLVAELGGLDSFSWIFSVYVVASAATVTIAGRLADLHGRKPLLLASMALFLTGSLLCALAWSMPSLIGFRVVQGIGAGGLVSLSQTVAGDMFSLGQRAKFVTALSVVHGLTGLCGPLIGTVAVAHVSWRWLFLAGLPPGLLAGVLMLGWSEQKPNRRPRFDVAGTLLFVLATLTLLLAIEQNWQGLRLLVASALLVVASALFLAFVKREHIAFEPIVPTWLLHNQFIGAVCAVRIIAGVTLSGVLVCLPFFAEAASGSARAGPGPLLVALLVGWPAGSAASGWLCLVLGFRGSALIGAFASGMSGLTLALASTDGSPAVIVLCVGGIGAANGLLIQSTQIGVQAAARHHQRGVVTGTLLYARTIGMAIGAGLLGSLVDETLATRMASAPAELATKLPSSADGVIGFIRDPSGDPRGQAYLQQALQHVSDSVFWGVAFLSVLATLLVLTVGWRSYLTESPTGQTRTPP